MIKTAIPHHHRPLTDKVLARENRRFHGTSGISRNNRIQGFLPAFMDTVTGDVYVSRFSDGRPAPVHLLDGLPADLVAHVREPDGARIIKSTVVSGFLREERFYTREEVAA